MTIKKIYKIVGTFNSSANLDQATSTLLMHGISQDSLSIPSKDNRDKKMMLNNSLTESESFYSQENVGIAEGAVIAISLYIGVVTSAALMIINNENLTKTIMVIIISALIAAFSGIFLAMIINKYYKHYIEKQLKKGGLILWIQLRERNQENLVKKILKDNHAKNIHLRLSNSRLYKTNCINKN